MPPDRSSSAASPTAPSAGELDPGTQESLEEAGLHYTVDTMPGIRRRKKGESFRFVDDRGAPIRDEKTLQRIRKLAIPPAYADVWICPRPNGHLQATGRDARGRKQYRYHPRWREVRDETKYGRMMEFARALPQVRRKVARDMALPGLPKEKVLATVVRLLETSLIRVGNDEYARTNRSYGLTTMRDRHVEIARAKVVFRFRGKSGKDHDIELPDARVAKIVKQCRDLPGQTLFQYLDEAGARHTIGSGDVNDYIRAIAGEGFTAKDFRTWAGTVLAALALSEIGPFVGEREAKKNVVQAVEAVSAMLGNTPAICRKCYVHPDVLTAYLDGALIATLQQKAAGKLKQSLKGLKPEEVSVLAFLKRRLDAEARKRARMPAAFK